MYNKELFEGVNRQEALKKLQAGGMSLRQSESLLDQVAGKAAKAHNYESATSGSGLHLSLSEGLRCLTRRRG